MKYTSNNNLKGLSFYQKSLDVFKLSRSVVSYVTYDKDVIELQNSKTEVDTYASHIVMDALGLAPRIAETENQKNPSQKLKNAKSLEYLIDRMYSNSKKLESMKVSGKDFIKLLRKELIHLRELHMQYVNSIL